jgi:hypothetical protein
LPTIFCSSPRRGPSGFPSRRSESFSNPSTPRPRSSPLCLRLVRWGLPLPLFTSCRERLSGNSDRPQTGPLQVGNKRPRSAIFGHCAPSMTTAEKPSGYFPDSLRRGLLGNSVSGKRGSRKPKGRECMTFIFDLNSGYNSRRRQISKIKCRSISLVEQSYAQSTRGRF